MKGGKSKNKELGKNNKDKQTLEHRRDGLELRLLQLVQFLKQIKLHQVKSYEVMEKVCPVAPLHDRVCQDDSTENINNNKDSSENINKRALSFLRLTFEFLYSTGSLRVKTLDRSFSFR